MRKFWAAALAAAALFGQAAQAETWVPIGADSAGARWELDIDSMVIDDDVVRTWTRQIHRRPQATRERGKTYTEAYYNRFDNCGKQSMAFGDVLLRDRAGAVVSQSGAGERLEWLAVAPGTVSEMMAKAICAINAFEEEADITSGTWRSFGPSAGKSSTVYMNLEGIIEIAPDVVSMIIRDDYKSYQYLYGLPYLYRVTSFAIDCGRHEIGTWMTERYISRTRLVMSEKVEPDELKMVAIPPSSLLSVLHTQACAAPRISLEEFRKMAGGGTDEAKKDGFAVGTAWATDKGYLVTASHVVAEGGKIAVYQNGDQVGEAAVVANDPANDLAVLKFTPTTAAKLHIIPLSTKPATLGRSVFTLGFPAPGELGQRVKMSAGEVSSTAGYQDDARYLQVSMPIQQGNSGGPVIGWDGSALAVVSTKLVNFEDGREVKPEMVNYAVKIAYLRPMLEELPDLKNYVAIAGANGDELITQAQTAVFMLVVGD